MACAMQALSLCMAEGLVGHGQPQEGQDVAGFASNCSTSKATTVVDTCIPAVLRMAAHPGQDLCTPSDAATLEAVDARC